MRVIKSSAFLLVIGLLSLFLASCGTSMNTAETTGTDKDSINTTPTTFQNPFANEEVVLGSIGHGATKLTYDKDKNRLPFEYNGQIFTMDYMIIGSGVARDNGLLLLLNGIPQLYGTDQDQEVKSLHVFHLPEESKEFPFQISFTPNTGKKGDTALCTVVSITNPDFKPDLKETQSYGIFHQSLPVQHLIHFNSDPPVSNIPGTFVRARDIRNETLDLTKDILQKIQTGNMQEINIETFNKEEKYQIYVNGNASPMDELAYSPDKALSFDVYFAGREGNPWAFSFFLDHEPVVFEDSLALTWLSEKGKAVHISFSLDPSELKDAETFYMLAAPMQDFPNADNSPMLSKTPSLLLHKE